MAKAADCQPGGPEGTAENYLKEKSDKQTGDSIMWENPNLTPEQIDYAAKDTHVGIDLFKYLAGEWQSKQSQEYCVKHFDVNFFSRSKDPNQMNNQQPKKKKENKSNRNENGI